MRNKRGARMAKNVSSDMMYLNMFVGHINDPTLKHIGLGYEDGRKYHDWCLDNRRLCRQLMTENIVKKFGVDVYTQFGLPQNFSLGSISEDVRKSKHDEQSVPIPLGQKFIEEMLACEKHPLTPPISRVVTKDQIYPSKKKYPDSLYDSVTTWYAGNVMGQTMLFKEIVNYPTTGKIMTATRSDKGFPNSGGSYELKTLINGKSDLVMELVRCDYNPIAPHPNYLDKKSEDMLKVPENIYGTHVHIANELFNVVYPNSANSPDVVPMDIDKPRLTFGQVIKVVKDSVNVKNAEPIFKSEYDSSSVVAKTSDVKYGKTLSGNIETRLEENTAKYKTTELYEETKDIPCDKVAKGIENESKITPRDYQMGEDD